MTGNDDDNDFDEKPDLTRIEKLPEFLHEEDPDIDSQLNFAGKDEESSEDPPQLDLSELEDSTEETPPEISSEVTPKFEPETAPEIPETPEEFTSAPAEEINLEQSEEWSSQSPTEFGTEVNSEEANDWNQSNSDSWEVENDNFEASDDETLNNEEEVVESEELPENTEETNFEEDPANFAEEESEEDQTQMISLTDKESSWSTSPQIEEKRSALSIHEPSNETPKKSPIELKKREDFQDIRNFGESITFGTVTHGGQPPFTVKVRGITYKEDAEDILAILREHGIITEENEAHFNQMLEHNSLLISQISEYSAIYLAHRLRRFKLQISVGLSDELSPSKHYDRDGRGLVTKYNLKQNVREHLIITKSEFDPKDVIVSTSNNLEGMVIKRYYEIVSSHTVITEEEMRTKEVSTSTENEDYFPNHFGLNTVYQSLANDLKNEAYKIEANAVLGVNYQITPMPSRNEEGPKLEYKITCTGNAVWLENQ